MMTEEQFSALVELINRLALYDAGILSGSSNRHEARAEVIEKARKILVGETHDS